MDLNEKIAARRAELAIQAENAKQAEKDALNVEVTKRLADQGILQSKRSEISESTVDAEVDKVFTKMAADRMTEGEKAVCFAFIFVGFCAASLSWWFLLGSIVWAGVFRYATIDRYKAEILAEGKLRTERGRKEAGQSLPK